MKKNYVLGFIMILFVVNVNAQISIRKDVVEKPILKPKAYDSLVGLECQQNLFHYNQYVGLDLFFIPRSSTHQSKSKSSSNQLPDSLVDYLFAMKKQEIVKTGGVPYDESYYFNRFFPEGKDAVIKKKKKKAEYLKAKEEYESKQKVETDLYMPTFVMTQKDKFGGVDGHVGTCRSAVENRYFRILDIKGKRYEKEFVELEKVEKVDGLGYNVAELQFTLRNNETGDTLYWIVDEARSINEYSFILVSTFEKKQREFKEKWFVCEKEISDLVELSSGEIIHVKKGDRWQCVDVTFLELEDYYLIRPFYILKNEQGQEVKYNYYKDISEFFVDEEVYKERIRLANLREEERQREEAERERRMEQERKQFKADCIKRFGEKNGNLICQHKVVLGMTKEMCRLAWGDPNSINTTTVAGMVHDQWVYSWKNYLYFENGKLTGIQN